ncbi:MULTISPECIES: hypothetical protein [Burkholderiaceae]|uniref:hypothetical protein n=1 Tax=Burkholderiaceae TaxID=119060 RepID=UPI0009E68FC8|nr:MULTISPECIES: hypothetical protein [Burkholderiaceae]
MTTSARDEDPGQPPTEVSKPVGDAIPAPVEPGLNQPLPSKEDDDNPLVDPDSASGVPPSGESDYA